MEIDFALLADAATVDAAGKLNVLGVFDRIQARDFPARHGRISLVMRFSAGVGEAGAHQVEIRLRGPEDQELIRLDGRMELGAGARQVPEGIKVPQVLNLDGIAFPVPGLYSFEILVDGEQIHSVPLHLEKATGGGPGPQGPATGGQGGPPPPFAFDPGQSAQA
jgi:hypothetical protein